MAKGVLIAEIISNDNDSTSTFRYLGGDGLITRQEALEIIEDVANGYSDSPKLAKDAIIFFVEGELIPIKLQTSRITASFEKKKPKKKTIRKKTAKNKK